MKIIDFIRLLRKHMVLLLAVPVVMAALVTFMTRKPNYVFASKTTLYTGLATGSKVEMDNTFNYAATNVAFDNLINIIKSRETLQEVAIRLLSQHLLMSESDPKYISSSSFSDLKQITPAYIYKLVANSSNYVKPEADSLTTISYATMVSETGMLSDPASGDVALPYNQSDYETTVMNLTNLMNSSDTNFVYRLLNFTHPHYSIVALSTIKAVRIASSDLVKLDYQVDDPGICQQTLAILNEVCIRNYKSIKANNSDAVVRYFENQLILASAKLNSAEDKLLKFNMDNNIINYYEQSKEVAVVKEQMDVSFNTKKVEIAGLQASLLKLEEKLGVQQLIQLKSSGLVEKKDLLGQLSYLIASSESKGVIGDTAIQRLAELKLKSDQLEGEILKDVNSLYAYGNSVEGIPLKDLLADWLSKVIALEDAKASLKVMDDNSREFLKQYAIYAPAGANLKRIEREISTSESEFLEILHGLNLANLKLQDNEISSNIKAVDPPYFPLSPMPTKRNILILAGFVVGFMLVLTSVLAMEYLDNTLKNPGKASRILKLPLLGVIPKILLRPATTNLPFVLNRMLEVAVQNIDLYLKLSGSKKETHTLLLFSTMKMEGKTVIGGMLARKLSKLGKKTLFLNYSDSSLIKFETEQTESGRGDWNEDGNRRLPKQKPYPLLNRLLGYPDPRIDYNNSSLDEPENYLDKGHYLKYNINDRFYKSNSYIDILEQNNLTIPYVPDYVIIEIPPVLHSPFPSDLLSTSDIPILVCRSNRTWSEADQSVSDAIVKITGKNIHFILNGVELVVVESIMGDLPKKRSRLRQSMKNVFRFQFFSQNQI